MTFPVMPPWMPASQAGESGMSLESPPESLRERSRRALLSRFPELGGILDAQPTLLSAIRDGDAVIDLDIGPTRLYSGDGRRFASDQVKAYLERPLRFFVTDLDGTNLSSGVSTRLYLRLLDECDRVGVTLGDLEVKPRYEGCFLLVLGLGLGFHLRELIERTEAGHILIIEPHEEFLRHSLEAIDWDELLTWAEERGRTFTFVTTDSLDLALRTLCHVITRQGAHFIDGAYVYLHYPARLLTDLRDGLFERVQTLYTSRGFFEDEMIMLDNTSANLARHRFRWLQNKLRPERSEPVLIIGSGPSIDQSLEHIKRLRERAVVFSCGSGLRVCLSNGIVPDFHCEIENGGWVFNALSLIKAQFPFTGITLIASATVDPRVPTLFDDTVLFFRDTVSGSRMLTTPDQEIFMAVPTVANTALRTALSLGFGTFYLFGVDCGTKADGKRHSDSAIYTHSETLRKMVERTELGFTHPGNFGGTVKSDWLFVFSRMLLEEAMRLYRPRVFNCSDGARLAHTVPKAAAGVTLPDLPAGHAAVKRSLLEALPPIEAGGLLATVDFEALKGETEDYRAAGLAMIDAALAEDGTFVQFWRRLGPFLDETTGRFHRASSMINCSLQSMPKIAMFFIHRIPDQALRPEVFRAFLTEYRAIFEFMCDELTRRFDDLIENRGRAAGGR